MRIPDSQLSHFIASAGLVSKKDLLAAESAATKENRSLAEALLAAGHLNEDDLRRVEAYILGLPFITLDSRTIDSSVISLIPEPVARDHNIVAYKKTDKTLEVALLNLSDLAAIEFIAEKTGLKVLPRFTTGESMREALLWYQKQLKDRFGDAIASAAKAIEAPVEGELSETAYRKLAETEPVVRLTDALLRHAIVQNATDIHIEPPHRDVLVRYRIDGVLRDALALPRQVEQALMARLKLLTKLTLAERKKPQDGRFKMELDGQKVSVRVSTLPVFQGEKITLRLVRENRSGFTLEGIGFHGPSLERVHQALRAKSGLILVAGPEGSGRTTTIYTILDLLNTPAVNISTIERPIEYQMPRVNQMEVKEEAGLGFEAGLRAILRQDPDIIMISEIESGAVAELAVAAAEAGRLVLACVRANSASGAVTRLLEMGIDPSRLSYALRLVIGQRLVRQLSTEKEPYTLAGPDRDGLSRDANLDLVMLHLKEEGVMNSATTWTAVPFYRPKSGVADEVAYSGRFGLHEIMPITPALRSLISSGTKDAELQRAARREGMLSLLEDGIYKAARGATSLEAVAKAVA